MLHTLLKTCTSQPAHIKVTWRYFEMKKITTAIALLISGNTFAHVSHASPIQHSSEHMLLAALLIPIAWLIARKVFK